MGGGNNITLSNSTKNKISESLKNNNKISKKIIQYNINDESFIKEWISINEIKRKLNYSTGNIFSCCKKKPKYPHAYGFGWRYYEDYKNDDFNVYELYSKKYKPINVSNKIDFNRNFKSIKEAMNYFSFKRKFIQRVLSGKRKTYKGYYFKYL